MNNVIIILALAQDNKNIEVLRKEIEKYNLAYYEIIFPYKNFDASKVGAHSYGSIINDDSRYFVESIGAFCSFAEGARVVANHANQYISTSPFIYNDHDCNDYLPDPWEFFRGAPFYIEGIKPKGKIQKSTKSKIGNDVWLGHNVIITNGANVGNGVIAGAGTIITKDVPDYVIVVGAPAKIIRFRYSPDEIEALNRICWWNWTDDQIREIYDDFFLPIGEFIAKYDE